MPKSRIKELRPWLVWLAGFYAVWISIVFVGNHWQTLVEHWGIALTMAIGSYAAGSTPMGGGTVGFPVLVLLFGEAPTLGRDFSFAIQSIGMTSATLFILCRRQPIEWPMLRWAVLGSAIGTPIGVLLLAPLVSGLFIKVLFAVVWCSFGVLHLYRVKDLCSTRAWPQEPIDSTGTRVFWWDCWREPRFRRLPEWAWTWCSTPC